jgi:bifunctional NMN adenylyltransferase/nudix hydrolase
MSNKVAVFIGRFQPFHNGHKSVIDKALETCNKIIIIVGSSNEPRTARNPFTFNERRDMIRFNYDDLNKVVIEKSINHYYNDSMWSSEIRDIVTKHSSKQDEIYLIGYNKDHSSYYLNMFPEWKSIEASAYTTSRYIGLRCFTNQTLDATYIRHKLYQRYHTDWGWAEHLPTSTVDVIRSIPATTIDELTNEFRFIEDYKKQWETSPYPPIFVTVDAVVTQSGHILMVHRGAQPGKGLCALPGGFIGQYETVKDACIRELYEETKIDIPKPALYGSIRASHVFDSPYRSQRGRTITHAFHMELDSKRPIPKVKGSDDAAKAFWIPLNALKREMIYEDHACIIEYFTGVQID